MSEILYTWDVPCAINDVGCFDRIMYYTRNPSANDTFEAPPVFTYIPGQPYHFAATTPITYRTPDEETFYVQLQLRPAFGILGADISLDGMTFDGNAAQCFNSTGCVGPITINVLSSDVQRIFDALYFVYSETTSSKDPHFIFMDIIRIPDDRCGACNTLGRYRYIYDLGLEVDMAFCSTFDGYPDDDDYYEQDDFEK